MRDTGNPFGDIFWSISAKHLRRKQKAFPQILEKAFL